MIFEIIIILAVIVLIAAAIWWVIGFFNRDEPIVPAVAAPVEEQTFSTGPPKLKLSKPAGFIPPPPPDPDAPKLKLSKPAGLVPPPPVPTLSGAPLIADHSTRFSITAQPAVRVLPSGFALHGVNVLCRGQVPWRTSGGYRLVFQVVDFEDATEGPLHCAIPGFGDTMLGMVRFVPDAELPPPGQYADWTELVFLPTSLFRGPRSGLRSLSLSCGMISVGVDSAKSVKIGATVFKVYLELPGFLDDDLDLSILISSRIVELAMACAAIDGVSDSREKQVIHEWIEEWSRRMAEKGAECETRFRSALKMVLASPARSTFTLESAVFALHSYAEGQRIEAFSLCVRVIAVDGVLHEKEMKMAEKLAGLLQIDLSIMRSLFDRQFANSGIVVSPDNLEALVGIDPSWDKERIREHLAERFMKWNSLSPSAKTTEDQARTRAMLDAIAKLRQKYA